MKSKFLWIITSLFVLLVLGVMFYQYRKKISAKEKMVQLYKQGLKSIYDKDNIFCADAQLAFYDSVLRTSFGDAHKIIVARYFKAVTLLKLGREKDAIEILKPMHERMKTDSDQLSVNIAKYLALSYLRLGERNNCIANHSMESCIFPIKGSGIYTDPYASQNSIEIYKTILEKNHDDLESRWLINIAYMTIGEYPSKVPAAWLIPGLDTDTCQFKVNPFVDMAGDLQLAPSRNMAGGVIIDDFNNDGYLDIITSSWALEDAMHYFKNNGDGTFTDISKQSGLSEIKGGLNLIQADYNNDGYTDILVLRGAWLGEFGKQPSTLLRNNGDGTFTDVTIESGILSFHPTQAATWADFNNDGWVDLFIGNETTSPQHPHPSELFINNHDGTFTNVAKEAGCETFAFEKGVTSADYNNDGWPDIFISTLEGQKILLKNKGVKSKIPQFENATHEAGLDKDTTHTFPTWFWDYDNDGWPDIFICGYKFDGSLAANVAAEALNKPLDNVSKMYLYRNNHDGTFINVSKKTGLDKPVFAMGSNFGDMDNDGWLDMYLGTGNPDYKSLIPNKLFKNVNGQRFADVTNSARVGNLQKGHGVAFADLDNDGDQDIFIDVGGVFAGDTYFNSLYINPGQGGNNWISILLQGTTSNRSAIGARIILNLTENG
ncbi:MAG TPA: VCBS repeat-containing protein, partial [Puia sp.]|nr:VCBS repeat-containing protein [Puia sp.]